MDTNLCLTVKPEKSDIYAYEIYHTFLQRAGVARIGISALFLGCAFFTAGTVEWYLTMFLIGFGLLTPVVSPILLWYKACQIAKKQTNITFRMSSEKLAARQNGQESAAPWRALPFVVWTTHNLLFYLDDTHALLLPVRQMAGQEQAVARLLTSLPYQDNIRISKAVRHRYGL